MMFRYYTMLYYAVLNLGSNEFGPVNEIEMLFLTCTLIVSSLFNALIFGDVVGLVSQLSQQSNERQHHLDEANNVMSNINLVEDNQTEVREFMQKTMATKER
jgi:hypothetical protein